MRWKPEAARSSAPPEAVANPIRESDAALRDQIRVDLEARGVDAAAADALAEQVRRDLDGSTSGYDAVLDGVAMGFRAQHAIAQQLAKSATDLQEIERLMGSFASELSKLDEVLEVLAAHLRRMRTTTPPAGVRILH